MTDHLNRELAAARAAIGRSFRRPHGVTVYTVRAADLVTVKAPWLTIVQCTCDTPGAQRTLAWTAIRKMVEVP